MKPVQLVQSLPQGPIDIIGDIHGEIDALHCLLKCLDCDPDKGRVTRPLVFVGDLIDRGPDSPAVVETVMRLVQAGVAQCILGNHELNVLLGLSKEGNGWFRGDVEDSFQVTTSAGSEHRRFHCTLATDIQAERYLNFFKTLPLALSREDLRIVHACWNGISLAQLPNQAYVASLTNELDKVIHDDLQSRGILEKETAEFLQFSGLRDLGLRPTRDLAAHAQAAESRQSGHPIKVLTSGQEERIPFSDIFYAGGKWRFVRRRAWWNAYAEAPAVVVGHYWRRRDGAVVDGKPDDWMTPRYTDWVGPLGNVFCVDYSVGRRFMEREGGLTSSFQGSLAALRWPERTLVFDDGRKVSTTGFQPG